MDHAARKPQSNQSFPVVRMTETPQLRAKAQGVRSSAETAEKAGWDADGS